MPLTAGAYLGTLSSRRVGRFKMFDLGEPVTFEVSWELMDDLERANPADDEREIQFERLRAPLEAMAQRRVSAFGDGRRLEFVVLTAADRSAVPRGPFKS